MRPDLHARIESLLPASHPRPEIQLLYDMLRDYPARGGKGIRSDLLLLSARAHGVRAGTPAWESALWLAAVVELFQNWVLIHDDIEDDSEERRGRPALHRQHGMPLALNAGDALHAYMWAAVGKANVPGAFDEVLAMIHRTAEGQHIDLAWVEHGRWDLAPADYLEMVRLKTSYYTVVVPLRLGALAAGAVPDGRFTPAGLALGAAFQIRDDVLNLVGEGAAYGKEIGGDLLEGKRTLIALAWLQGASPPQRQTFLNEMRKSRTDKDPAVIAQMLSWMRHSGAVEAAMREAHAQAESGLPLLQAALQNAPDPAAAREIGDLVEQLATRQA